MEANGAPQVMHADLRRRAVAQVAGTQAFSVFLPLTECPLDGRHGGWVAAHSFSEVRLF